MSTKLNCCRSPNSFRQPMSLILSRLGCRAFGESREQEAAAKVAEVAIPPIALRPIRWHMVGRIQRNKARSIAGWAYAAHSVDSAKLVAALDRASAARAGRGRPDRDRCGSTSRSASTATSRAAEWTSADPDARRRAVRRRSQAAAGAAVRRPDGHPAAGCRPRRGVRAFAGRARSGYSGSYQQRLGLSAGMSSDLEAAVKHGSTCVRVGTALLGQRPLTSP